MPSLTMWNRLEPRPRAESLTDALAARVRDPLWMLARQWQLGELRGEDAGSPAIVEIAGSFRRVDAGGAASPLERAWLAEEREPDLLLRVSLGRAFERLLEDHGISALAPAFRQRFSLPGNVSDPAERELLDVCGSGIDGVALLRAARTSQGHDGPPELDLPEGARRAAASAVAALAAWSEEVHGPLGDRDATSWNADRLRYEIPPSDTGGAFAVRPSSTGECDWFSFDATADPPAERVATELRLRAAPTHVRARGIPNVRFWDFETATIDFGDVRMRESDLGRVFLVDFMLVQANDWFVVPIEQPLGTACRLDTVLVHDVFGSLWLVRGADTDETRAPAWSMFRPSTPKGGVAPVLVVPATAASAEISGRPIEEVDFVRDDLAHVVWAIERTGAVAAEPPAAPQGLRYRVQTDVPRNWFPLVPVPGAEPGERAFVRAPLGSTPNGRILRPTRSVWRLHEDEISSLTTLLARVPRRARWTDGRTHVWVQRRRQLGESRAIHPLRFDGVTDS